MKKKYLVGGSDEKYTDWRGGCRTKGKKMKILPFANLHFGPSFVIKKKKRKKEKKVVVVNGGFSLPPSRKINL